MRGEIGKTAAEWRERLTPLKINGSGQTHTLAITLVNGFRGEQTMHKVTYNLSELIGG